jgi:protocatechuate 3,4-dioxygenase beta subunit
VTLILAAAAVDLPQAHAQARPAPESGTTLEFCVIAAEDGEPLPDVALAVLLYAGPGKMQRREEATDARGRCRIEIPGGPWAFVSISARKEGFVPVRAGWGEGRRRAGPPASYTLRLERGTTIGGLVRDEQGRPIAGARVYPLLAGRKGRRSEPEEVYLGDDYFVETDAAGRWRCAMMPADLGKEDQVGFGLAHPDFMGDTHRGYPRALPIERLRDQSGVFVMHKGVPVSGRVLDSQGRPIAGAAVALGLGYSASEEEFGNLRTRTDAGGRFRFAHAEPGPQRLMAEADGFAPGRQEVAAGAGMAAVELRLASWQEEQRYWGRKFDDYRHWLSAQQAEDRKRADREMRRLVLGLLLGLAALAALASWAWGRRRRPGPTSAVREA